MGKWARHTLFPNHSQLGSNHTQLEFDFSPNLCYNKYRKKDEERGKRNEDLSVQGDLV